MDYRTSPSNTNTAAALGFYKSRIKSLQNGAAKQHNVMPIKTLAAAKGTTRPGYAEVCYVDLVYDDNNQPVYEARVEKYLDNLR